MRSFAALFITTSVLLFQCSLDIAGGPGSGSETTNSITVAAAYPDGSPAAGAIVRLRASDYLPLTGSPGNTSAKNLDTITDNSGSVLLTNLDSGSYSIEINDRQGYAALVSFQVDSGDTDSLGSVLKKTGTISGSVNSSTEVSSAIAEIYGLERVTAIDPLTGEFTIEDIPEGTYSIRFSSEDDPEIKTEVYGVTVMESSSPEPLIVGLSWPFVQNIFLNTSDDGASVSETILDFPVLIRLSSSDFDFSTTSNDMPRIRFTNSHGDTLPCQIELWDSLSGKAVIWVRVDTVRGDGLTVIRMLSGKNDASMKSDGADVFTTGNGFQAVWHLEGDGSREVLDATENSFHGTPAGSKLTSRDCIIGKGLEFSDSGYIEIPNSADGALSYPQDGAFTLSAWVNTENLDTFYQDIISKGNFQYGLQINRYYLWNFYVYKSMEGWVCTDAPAESGSWHFLAAVSSGNAYYLYVNGTLADSVTVIKADSIKADYSHNVMLGRRSDIDDRYFRGKLDEIRISNRARSPAWIRLCYENQRPDQKFVIIRR